MKKLTHEEASNILCASQTIQVMLADISEERFQETIKNIRNSIFLQDRFSLKILLSSIKTIMLARPLKIKFYLSILAEFLDKICSFFTSHDLLHFFSKFPFVQVFLYENQAIDINTILSESKYNKSLFRLFFFEIQEHDKNLMNEYSNINEIKDSFINEYNNSDFKIIEELHKKNRALGCNETILAQTIRDDDLESFQNIITQNNIDLNSQIKHSHYEFVKFINYKDNMPTLVEYSAFFGSINIFKYLYIQSNSVILPPMTGRYAVAGGNSEIISLCIERGFDLSKNCMNVAIAFHRYKVCEFLNSSVGQPYRIKHFMRTIKFYNINCFFTVLPIFISNPNITDKFGDWTLLHCACNNGNLDMVQFIISLPGVDKEKVVHPEIMDDNSLNSFNGASILHSTSYKGHLDILRYLLEVEKMNLDVFDNNQKHAIHFAAINNKIDVLRYLIEERKVNSNLKDKYGQTILHIAVNFNHIQLVEAILNLKTQFIIDINAQTVKGKTPLFIAAKRNSNKILKILVEKGAAVDMRYKNGYNLLHYACECCKRETIKYIISIPGIDLNARDNQGRTPYMVAFHEERRKVVKFLREVDGIDKTI